MNEDHSTADSHPNYSRPVIPILISLMVGVASGVRFPGFGWVAYVGVTTGLVVLCLFIKKGKAAFGLPLVLFFLLGYLLIQPWVSPVFPHHHIIRYADAKKRQLTGTIEKNPKSHGDRLRFVLKTESLESNGVSFPVTGKVRVTVRRIVPGLFAGDRISIIAKIRKIRNFNNPGGFDYKRYMAFKGICVTAYVHESRLMVLEKNAKKTHRRILDTVRRTLSDFIDQNAKEEPREVLKALIVGDKTGVSPRLREAFNRSGTAHLLAISGLHIGIVATVFFLLFRRGLSYIKPLLWSAWTHKGAAILSMLPVVAYGLIAGMSPSTQRAVVMVVVFLTTFLFEREHDPINTLSLAAITIIIIHPPALFSISFQLSFAAVFSILHGIAKIRFKRAGKSNRIVEKLISFFWVSFFATIGTIPIVMFYFNQISTVGIFANFVVVPIIGFVVTPMGLLSAFLYPVCIECASFIIRISATMLEIALELIRFFSTLPFAAIKTVTPTIFEISCYYLMVWAILSIINVRSAENQGQDAATGRLIGQPGALRRILGPSRLVGKNGAAIVFLIVFMTGGADAFYWLDRRFFHNDLKVTVIDIGQGNASLIEFPDGYTLLIDGGGFSDNSSFDVGERIVAPFLWRKKIMTVDTIILSHPNSDHLNGLLYIARHFHVKQIWTNNDVADTKGYHKFIKIVETAGIPVPVFKEISRTHIINGVTLQILYPPKDFQDRRDKERWRSINNSSMVIRVKWGSTSFLFPGDIKARAEKELVEIEGDNLKSTVLIAPHHGSKTSSTACFLDRVNPEVIIVSAGWKNAFNFPHPSVLRRYNEGGSRILRTDHHGAVEICVDGASVEIRTTVKAAGNPIHF